MHDAEPLSEGEKRERKVKIQERRQQMEAKTSERAAHRAELNALSGSDDIDQERRPKPRMLSTMMGVVTIAASIENYTKDDFEYIRREVNETTLGRPFLELTASNHDEDFPCCSKHDNKPVIGPDLRGVV